LGKTAEIAGDVRKIEGLHPTEASSYVAGSNLYDILFEVSGRHRSDLELAVSNMQAALKQDPLYAQRYGQLAVYDYELGQNEQAKANLLKDLSFEQDDFSSWILLAKIYQAENNKTGVISALTKAFDLNPRIPQLKYLLYYAKVVPDIRQLPIDVEDRPPEI
jgi:tetratricopeptide (TPR) repeat protein